MNSRNTSTKPLARGNIVFYVSLALLIGVIVYATMVLPTRG